MKKFLVELLEKLHRKLELHLYEEDLYSKNQELEDENRSLEKRVEELEDQVEHWKSNYYERKWA